MMTTPICDFVARYAARDTLRLHMPGHKGVSCLGFEERDITEIDGADSLYEAGGIIRASEQNASALFGCPTFYSTEGSSQCIRAMLYLAAVHAKETGRTPRLLAGRNAHKTFLSAAALLDLDVTWLYPQKADSYLSCAINADTLDAALSANDSVTAVYLTAPDYLGNCLPISDLAAVCHRHGALLLVDNAHGAYLKFLPNAAHPIDLGADLCCDSAHKTLPVLTGGAYLHIAPTAPTMLFDHAKVALALFGSTSPSYLILQSLDAANRYLEEYPARLAAFASEVQGLKTRLLAHGFTLCGDEVLKLTLTTKPYGWDGREFAAQLRERGVECEFADPDFVVMMLTPEVGREGLRQLETALCVLPKRNAITTTPPRLVVPTRVMSIREAALSPCEVIPARECTGRVLAAATVGCPPAVPIVVSGERIDEDAVRCFAYYGIDTCTVVKES